MRSRNTASRWSSESTCPFSRHLAQRVDRFHTHARILIVHQRIEQRLSDDVLRLRPVQRFQRFQPHRGVLVRVYRLAQRCANVRIIVASAKQLNSIHPHIRIKTLAVVQEVNQNAFHFVVIYGSLHRHRLPGIKLQLYLRRLIVT